MKIIVVGLGYVGISNAAVLAVKNEVIGIDISEERINLVNNRNAQFWIRNLRIFVRNLCVFQQKRI